MQQKVYRQGDVVLTRIEALPSGKKSVRKNGVLAYGEVTGHSHAIHEGQAEVLEMPDGLFLSVSESGVSIGHQEHGTINVPPGLYSVGIKTEFDYFEKAIRQVQD
jgi:hypothetical protein